MRARSTDEKVGLMPNLGPCLDLCSGCWTGPWLTVTPMTTDSDGTHGVPRLEQVLDHERGTEMDTEQRSRGEAQDCH